MTKPTLVKVLTLLLFVLLFTESINSGSLTPLNNKISNLSDEIKITYDAIREPLLNYNAFYEAVQGQKYLIKKGLVKSENILSIIDYSLPSSSERLFVIDLERNMMVYKSLVAHGRNSGENYSLNFSNSPQSHQSSLGFFITENAYIGNHGYSLILDGVDTGFNDYALKRAIVIHAASYATAEYIKRYGRLGRSYGCPALPPDKCHNIIDYIKDGSVLFSYYPDSGYFKNSEVIKNCLEN